MIGRFSVKKHFHFIGIGGIGMSGLAEILLREGYTVSGSDRSLSELTTWLESRGAVIFEGHRAENLPGNCSFVVYSSAVPEDNPERLAARANGIPEVRRAELLGWFFNRKNGIAVSGTHGKTTTTSLISHIFISAGLDPTVIIGGRLKNLKTNARLGSGSWLIAEADEYDRSFLTLHPALTVVNNIEADHLDIYHDLEDVQQTFRLFMSQTRFDGLLVLNADDPRVMQMAGGLTPDKITFGLKPEAEVRAVNLVTEHGVQSFDLLVRGAKTGTIRLALFGKHNVYNSLAAIAVSLQAGLSEEKIAEALATFSGVERRLEKIGTIGDCQVYDDYAHHPTEVAATIQAARTMTGGKITVIFQPHLFSRTRDFYTGFAEALAAADTIILCPIYPAREKALPGVTSELIAGALQEKGHRNISLAGNLAEAEAIARCEAVDGLVLTMGAGDVWQISKNLSAGVKHD